MTAFNRRLLAALTVSAVAGVGLGAAIASPPPPTVKDKLGRAESRTPRSSGAWWSCRSRSAPER